jgi:hypothetical protein
VPPNFIWQRKIESRYPGFPSKDDWQWLRNRRPTNQDRVSGGAAGGSNELALKPLTTTTTTTTITKLTPPLPSSSSSSPLNNNPSDNHSFVIHIPDNNIISNKSNNNTSPGELESKIEMIKDKPTSDLPNRWRLWKPSSLYTAANQYHRNYHHSHHNQHNTIPQGLRNFLMKFFLDQTICSVSNILLFIWLINLLKGATLAATWAATLDDFGPIMIARLQYRPLVSTLMYAVIPVDRRVVFGSACGVLWGIYLSLYAVV